MTPREEREFVEGAFQKLKERGWFPGEEFEPSTITEQEIAAFEQMHQVKLPSLYKTFLMCRGGWKFYRKFGISVSYRRAASGTSFPSATGEPAGGTCVSTCPGRRKT